MRHTVRAAARQHLLRVAGWHRALACGAVLTLALTIVLARPLWAQAVPAENYVGADRYAAATAVSKAAFPSGAPAVVVVNGLRPDDALGAPALAGAVGGPVLLATATGLPSGVAGELARLAPTRVFLVGRVDSFTSGVAAAVRRAAPGASLVRLTGASRASLAAEVASQTIAAAGPPRIAFVVGEEALPDALACGPVAAAAGSPVYALGDVASRTRLVRELTDKRVGRVVILGGTVSVTPSEEASVVAVMGGDRVRRIGGVTREQVALRLASFAVEERILGWSAPVLTCGTAPTDLIAGSVLAARRRSPQLLLKTTGTPDTVAAALWTNRAAVTSFAFVGGYGSLSRFARTDAQQALLAPPFSGAVAAVHVRALTRNGPRVAGSWSERTAIDYAAAQLAACGYTVSFQRVSLPKGRSSRNLIAEKPGATPDVIVVGAHIDSKLPAPGGNDNASGVATMLELARCVASAPLAPTVRFVAFTGEEMSGSDPDSHHFGSRQYVASLSSSRRARIHSAVSLDMVGYGGAFTARNMGRAPQTVVRSLRSWGSYSSQPVSYLRDTSAYGQSDHEAFERRGIPSAWLEWRSDWAWHSRSDTASHVRADRLGRTGKLTRGWLLALTPAKVSALRP